MYVQDNLQVATVKIIVFPNYEHKSIINIHYFKKWIIISLNSMVKHKLMQIISYDNCDCPSENQPSSHFQI